MEGVPVELKVATIFCAITALLPIPLTTTLPLQVEILYNEYNYVQAFAAASLLCFLALLTLAAKAFVEKRVERARAEAQAPAGGVQPGVSSLG